MPRTRASEAPLRPSPTGPTPRGPRHLRTSSSDSDPLHQQPLTERTPRLVTDRRSPRVTQSDPTKQKKLGTRITDLETQLVQAQHELKSLKHQLSSAEAAKKQAQDELTKKRIKKPTTTKKLVRREKPPTVTESQDRSCKDSPDNEFPENIHPETDVFEVPVEKMLVESKAEPDQCPAEEEKEAQSLNSELSEAEKPSVCDEMDSKNEDTSLSKAMVDEKETEKQMLIDENQTLKQQLEEAKSQIAAAHSKEEEMTAKLDQLGQELEASKANEAQLKEKLLDTEAAKESLDTEMKKMKVQTEQWRKAADAAAAVLAGGVENGRMSERFTSINNHFNGISEPPINSFGGYLGSPPGIGDDTDDDFGRKKKGSGIRMLGDLWKKKGQK